MINFNKQKRNKIASILIVLCGSHIFSTNGGWAFLNPEKADQGDESAWSLQDSDLPAILNGKVYYYILQQSPYIKQRIYNIEGAPIMRYTELEGYALVSSRYTVCDMSLTTSIDAPSTTKGRPRCSGKDDVHILSEQLCTHTYNEPAIEKVNDFSTIMGFSKGYTKEIYFMDYKHCRGGCYFGCEKYNLSINTTIDSDLGEKSQRTDRVTLITNLVMNESLIYQVLDRLQIYGSCFIEASPVILRTDIENHVKCICFTSTYADYVRLPSNYPVDDKFSRVELAEERKADDGFTNIIP